MSRASGNARFLCKPRFLVIHAIRVSRACCEQRLSEAVPHALTPNTVELIPTLGALSPRGGPVQDPVLTACEDESHERPFEGHPICGRGAIFAGFVGIYRQMLTNSSDN